MRDSGFRTREPLAEFARDRVFTRGWVKLSPEEAFADEPVEWTGPDGYKFVASKRVTSAGVPIPLGYREETDAEFRARILANL